MHGTDQRPSAIIAMQKRIIEEQEGIIAILKGALAAAGGETVPSYQPWMKGLTPQEQALLGALHKNYPNPVDKFELLELIPGYDHVQERSAQLVNVKVCHLRKKLGAEAIENVWGRGYRLGRAQYEAMCEAEGDLSPSPRAEAAANVVQLGRRAA